MEKFDSLSSYSREGYPVNRRARGFTMVETLIVVALIAILLVATIPNIINTLETRNLENTARDILVTLQSTKFQAVRDKLDYRVRFQNVGGNWVFDTERENTPGTWTAVPGVIRKSIPRQFTLVVNLPGQAVAFSALGLVTNFSAAQNTLVLQSPKLKSQGKPDQRIVSIYAGGSFQFTKSSS